MARTYNEPLRGLLEAVLAHELLSRTEHASMMKLVVAIALCASIGACGTEEKVHRTVLSRVMDASEADIGELTNSGNLWCGTVKTEAFNTYPMEVPFVSDGEHALFILRHARTLDEQYEASAAIEPYAHCVQGLGSDRTLKEWVKRANDRIARRALYMDFANPD